MIKSIVFDWGGVLIDRPRPGLLNYFSKYFNVSEEKFNNAHKKYVDSFQKGTLTEDLYWDKICTDLSVKKSDGKSLWKQALKSAHKEKQDVFNIVSILKNNGYQTGFLSNIEIPTMEFFYEQGYDIFNVLVFSCKEGYRKPEKEIYEITLTRLKTQPEETLFIDDREENIRGAENLGIKAILFENSEQLKEKLASFGLKIG